MRQLRPEEQGREAAGLGIRREHLDPALSRAAVWARRPWGSASVPTTEATTRERAPARAAAVARVTDRRGERLRRIRVGGAAQHEVDEQHADGRRGAGVADARARAPRDRSWDAAGRP